MSKILFIQPFFHEQFGIMALAAIAKKQGHTVQVAIGTDAHILKKVRTFKPEIVGFSIITGHVKHYLSLISLIKNCITPSPMIMVGGPHPTFFPEIVLNDQIVCACRGEGEGALLDVISRFQNKAGFDGIPNLVIKTAAGALSNCAFRPLVNLDDLPFPDRDIYNDYPLIAQSSTIHFMAGRGCPYNCSFCFNKQMKSLVADCGPWIRYRSPENLLEEIGFVVKKKNPQFIMFMDDTFILNKNWLFAFLESYSKSYKIPFSCNVRADLLTKDMVLALKTAGCYRVIFGVESGIESFRNQVLDKKLTDEQIKTAAAWLKESKIPFITNNMMGLPLETFRDAVETLKLNIAIGTEIAWTSTFQPFPGTDLAHYCLEKGLIQKMISPNDPIDAHGRSVLRQPEIDRVMRLQKFVYIVMAAPWTLPLVVFLTRFKADPLFFVVHRLSYLLLFFRKYYRHSFWQTIKEGYYAWIAYKS